MIKHSTTFPTLDTLDVAHKRVLVRLDLNVPMSDGRVTDNTRVVRLLPTIEELLKKKAKIIILSHLGRPNGRYEPDLSLAPLVDALAQVLKNVPIRFGVDCIGDEADQAVASLKSGEILLLENVRFHAGEEKNDPKFAKALAAHGEFFINDAFSCAHRSHASVVGLTKYLPFAAGRLMEEELLNLEKFLTSAKHPLTAIVGGAKVSSKIALLENLIAKVDTLVIGGAMAHTFLLAQGHSVGHSLAEADRVETAKKILALAKKKGCRIILPEDVIVRTGNGVHAKMNMVNADAIPASGTVLDAGNRTIRTIEDCLHESKAVLWNGPMGLFETRPFDVATLMIARTIASLTYSGKIHSVAGGGDTVAALALSGLTERFSYVSTAGGAFLEWIEGKVLPGIAALQQ